MTDIPMPAVPTISSQVMKALAPSLASAAQEVYDDWMQDADGFDDEYGGGGICHSIASAFVGTLDMAGIEATTVFSTIGDNHVWAIASLSDGIWTVDIHPGIYETGSGYNWTKREGIVFEGADVHMNRISDIPLSNDAFFEAYGDE